MGSEEQGKEEQNGNEEENKKLVFTIKQDIIKKGVKFYDIFDIRIMKDVLILEKINNDSSDQYIKLQFNKPCEHLLLPPKWNKKTGELTIELNYFVLSYGSNNLFSEKYL